MLRLVRRASLAAVALIGGACAAPPVPAPVAQPAVVVTAAPAPVKASPPEEALPSREEALKRGRALAAAREDINWDDAKAKAAWLDAHKLDENEIRRALQAVAAPCLAEHDREAQGCKALGEEEAWLPSEILMELLGEITDPARLGSASQRLLLRIGTRGIWRADLVLKRILERRMLARLSACTPPTAAEIEAAKRALSDFAVRAPGNGARWPTAAELDDLAYLYAAIDGAGPEVGATEEDQKSQPLPDDHPDLAARAALRAEVKTALFDGDLERHLQAVEAYLRTLGYPGPLRLAQEGDERWGGAGASYMMRDAALSAEILGRYELAEALYRRANPGGGMCGTSVGHVMSEQVEGVIRVAEQQRGCRAAAAERLFAAHGDDGYPYGPARLARAGFDVARLYAGALPTLGRDDADQLAQAFGSLPERSDAALARLQRLGTEAWATRIRAVEGYADAAGGAALDRLLVLAETAPRVARLDAIRAVGDVADDRGWDPCVKLPSGHIRLHGVTGSRERPVRSVMNRCETRIPARAIEATVRRLAALAGDTDPQIRTAVARALGRIASPSARPALAKLTRDPYVNGKICTTREGKPEVCEPHHEVARAAHEALEAIARTQKDRAEQRAELAKERGAKK
jgi:hypothetical protein